MGGSISDLIARSREGSGGLDGARHLLQHLLVNQVSEHLRLRDSRPIGDAAHAIGARICDTHKRGHAHAVVGRRFRGGAAVTGGGLVVCDAYMRGRRKTPQSRVGSFQTR